LCGSYAPTVGSSDMVVCCAYMRVSGLMGSYSFSFGPPRPSCYRGTVHTTRVCEKLGLGEADCLLSSVKCHANMAVMSPLRPHQDGCCLGGPDVSGPQIGLLLMRSHAKVCTHTIFFVGLLAVASAGSGQATCRWRWVGASHQAKAEKVGSAIQFISLARSAPFSRPYS